jgi:hypothetical protein
MKNPKIVFLFFFFCLMFAGFNVSTLAQSEPVLYFCERYDSELGEVGVSDRFTTGYLTVMVKCDYTLNLKDVNVQFDKYNFRTGKFEYYKKFSYTVDRDMKYIYFAKNSESDLKFSDPGFYRVFLLDSRDKTVASALIEIIER